MRSEFEFINDIKSRYNLSRVGDDCAVLRKDDETDLLITSDMLVEGIDFRHERATPEQIGHKALAVSLSDIAAMGGTPTYAMLSIAVEETLWKGDFLDRFYTGWSRLAEIFKVELIGGDVSRTSGALTIDSTVLGEVPGGTAVLRSGAKPGELIYVMGYLGAAAGGLALLSGERDESSSTTRQYLIGKQLQPSPSIYGGKYLRKHGLATSMIDISDGLSSDLAHICEASKVGAEIELGLVPVDPALEEFFSREEALKMALDGGEDFTLLFTVDSENVDRIPFPDHVTRVGRVTADAGRVELVFGDTRSALEARGYRHF